MTAGIVNARSVEVIDVQQKTKGQRPRIMAKIGRNEKCPCSSGKKYKRCCGVNKKLATPQPQQQDALKVTLLGEVERLQDVAVNKQRTNWDLGVFFFYSNAKGDGWLLEMTARDCVQVAKDGELLPPPIDENAETIEINWSHTYSLNSLNKKQLELTAYEDGKVQILPDAPAKEINAAMRRVVKKFSKEQLEKVHLTEPETADVS